MSWVLKIAFGGYSFIAAMLGGNGIAYLMANKVMPYHLIAMGSTWEQLDRGVQVMSLNFMKAAGAGMLTTSIAMIFLLLKPFKAGETWARWALLVISLSEILLITLRIMNVRANTTAEPPLIPNIVMGVVAIVSFILPMVVEKSNKQQISV